MEAYSNDPVSDAGFPVVDEPLIEHLVSGTPLDGQIRNVGTGKCMTANRGADNWMSVQTAPCNAADPNQIFSLDNGLIRNKSECVTVTYENDTNCCGKQFFDARILSCNEGIPGSINGHSNHFIAVDVTGPFRIQADKSSDLAFTDSDGTVRNFRVNNSDKNQMWVMENLAQTCMDAGIPLAECSKAGRASCDSYPALTNKFEVCPAQFCTKNPTDQRCINWCKDVANKPGACDTIYRNYCKANPQEQDICACINRPSTNPGFDVEGWNNILSSPVCYLDTCNKNPNAYKTWDQANVKQCPNIQACLSNVNLEAGQNMTTGNVVLNCGQKSSNSSSNNTSTSTSETTVTTVLGIFTVSESDRNLFYVGIGGFVLLILLAIGFIVWYFKSRKVSPKMNAFSGGVYI